MNKLSYLPKISAKRSISGRNKNFKEICRGFPLYIFFSIFSLKALEIKYTLMNCCTDQYSEGAFFENPKLLVFGQTKLPEKGILGVFG